MGSSSRPYALFHPSAFLTFNLTHRRCSAWQLGYLTERKMVTDKWEQRTMAFYTGCVLGEQECKKSSGQVEKRRRPSLWNLSQTAPHDQVTLPALWLHSPEPLLSHTHTHTHTHESLPAFFCCAFLLQCLFLPLHLAIVTHPLRIKGQPWTGISQAFDFELRSITRCLVVVSNYPRFIHMSSLPSRIPVPLRKVSMPRIFFCPQRGEHNTSIR